MGARRVRVEDVRDGDETTVFVTADPRVVQATEEAVRRRVAERLGGAVASDEDPRIRAAAQVVGEDRDSFLRRAALRHARRVLRSEDEGRGREPEE